MSTKFKSSVLNKYLVHIEKIAPWAVLFVILLLSLWLRGRYVWVEAFSYDEGHWLMFGVLANAGYAPYTVTFVGIPPLALWAIQLGVKLFGATLAARYPMMLFSLLGIAGAFLSFRPWRGWLNLLPGLLAAVFLSFDGDYFRGSGSIMSEVPSVALALISFVLAQQYYTNRRLFWLALSGATFALSLALKIFVVFLPALIGLLIVLMVLTDTGVSWPSRLRRLAISSTVWLLGALSPWVLFIIIYDPQAMFEQIFLFRLAFREVSINQGSPLLENASGVGQMIVERTPLLIGAILGAIVGWRQRQLQVWSWSLWLILAVFPLIWQTPLRARYAVMLLPPLAVLSAVAVAYGIRKLIQLGGQNIAFSWLVQPATALLILVFIAWPLIASAQTASQPASPDIFPDLNLDAVQYVWNNTTEDDCIVTDDQRFAFATNRLVPAVLSETAIGRLATGWLTADDIIEQIELHNCSMVVYADWRFAQYLPQLTEKLRNLYFLEIPFAEDVIVFAGKKHNSQQPAVPREARFGQEIVLTGIDLSPTSWRPGQEIRLATYWRAIKPPDRAYKIFLQVRNGQNEAVLNIDHFPFPAPDGDFQLIPNVDDYNRYSAEDVALYPKKGMIPTNGWPVGSIIREVTAIRLPSTLPPGTYSLYAGLYDPETLVRLPVYNSLDQSDEFLLTSVEVFGPVDK